MGVLAQYNGHKALNYGLTAQWGLLRPCSVQALVGVLAQYNGHKALNYNLTDYDYFFDGCLPITSLCLLSRWSVNAIPLFGLTR